MFITECLLHVVNNLHELFSELVGLLHGLSLAVDADDRLGVRFTQMYPTIGEVDLYAIDIVNLCGSVLGKHLLNLNQNSIYIGLRGEVDTILGNLILREGGTKLAYLTTLLSETAKEQSDTYEGVATVVALRIDNSTITLATDNSANFLHLCSNVNLAYCSGGVLATMLLGYIAQSAC